MKCNICGTNMRAVTYNSDGYGERLVILDDFNPGSGRYEMVGKVMYCPECGNLQVESRKTERLRWSRRSSSIHIISKAKRCYGHVCPCSHHVYRGHGGMVDREDKVDN